MNNLISQDNYKRGIVLMLLSVFVFALMNIVIKHLQDHLNVLQVSFFRTAFALIPTSFMLMTTTGLKGLKTSRTKGHLFRATTGTISMLSLFYSFHLLPLATAVAFNFTGPLFLTIFALIFLKEPVSSSQWRGLLVGFLGILIVVRPWEAAQNMNMLGISIGFVNAIFYGLSMVGVRSLGRTEPATTTVFYFMFIGSLLNAIPLPWVWVTPTPMEFVLLALGGILGGIGQLLVTRAYQYAPAGVISPYGYVAILWAMGFGYIFWNEIPSWSVYVGGCVIILSNVFGFRSTITKPVPEPAKA